MPTNDLAGKKALVCGGSQGIGLAAARKLAERGAAVTILSRTISQEFPHLVADLHQIESLIDVLARQSKPEFQILINNSGGPAPGPILNATPDQFLAAFRQHVLASHLLVQWLLPAMKAAKYGRVINIISTSVREPIELLGVSNTTRGAMASWSKTLSREVGPFGVTVNNVLPGATKTQRIYDLIEKKAAASGKPKEEVQAAMEREIPSGRFAEPAEIGAAIAFLASPDASYISGVSLQVDGGRMHVI